MDKNSPESIFEAHRKNAESLFKSRTAVSSDYTAKALDDVPAPTEEPADNVTAFSDKLAGVAPPDSFSKVDSVIKPDVKADNPVPPVNDTAPDSTPRPVTVHAVPAASRAMLQRDTGRVGKILATVFGILAAMCFVSIFITACFAQEFLEASGNEWVMIATFGGTFLFAGIAILSSGILFGALFGAIGGVITAASLIWGLGSPDMRDILMYVVLPLLGTGAFVVVGLCMLIIPRRIAARMAKEYTEPVNAVVVRKTLRTHRDSKGRRSRSYYLTWEYDADGKRYRYASNTGRSPERRDAGDTGVLYVRPGDYGTVWEKPEMLEKIVLTVIGLVFAGMGAFAFIAALIGIVMR